MRMAIDNAIPLFGAWEGLTSVRPAGKAAEWDGPRALSGSLSADPGLLQVLLVLLVGRGVIIVTAGVVAEVKIRHIRRI